jgi:hypothetical protein
LRRWEKYPRSATPQSSIWVLRRLVVLLRMPMMIVIVPPLPLP